MMKIATLILAVILSPIGYTIAQQRLNSNGTIEYVRTVNTYAVIKKMYQGKMDGVVQQVFEKYQESNPQFNSQSCSLTFGDHKTLFTPGKEERPVMTRLGKILLTDQHSVIYSDFMSGKRVTSERFRDETYLIQDTIQKINWKITDEIREIAGFTCRRANALILDSIYVVAFYTNEIQVSSGPEKFGGLPGMILELALPHDNLIWRAKKVEIKGGSDPIVQPMEGKSLSAMQFDSKILGIFEHIANRKWARLNILDAFL